MLSNYKKVVPFAAAVVFAANVAAQAPLRLGSSTAGPWVTLVPQPIVFNQVVLRSLAYITWSGTYPDYRIHVGPLGGPMVTLADSSISGASLCIHSSGQMVLAWSGVGNNFLNVMYSADAGKTWGNKKTLYSETSRARPVLVSFGTSLLLSWTGTDGRINFLKSPDGFTWDTGRKITLAETAIDSPAVQVGYSDNHTVVYLAWTGTDLFHHLNLIRSDDLGASWGGKLTLADTSVAGPAIGHLTYGRVVLSWAGTDANHSINAMEVYFAGGKYGFTAKRTYPQSSDHAPMVGFFSTNPLIIGGDKISPSGLVALGYDSTVIVWTGRDLSVMTMNIPNF